MDVPVYLFMGLLIILFSNYLIEPQKTAICASQNWSSVHNFINFHLENCHKYPFQCFFVL